MYEIVCNEVKPIQVSRSCVVMFIPLSHAGQTCVECCKDIRVLLYSDGQNRAYFLAYRHRWSNVIHTYQVGNIIQQLFLIYRHTERMCVEYLIYWLNKLKWPHILNSIYFVVKIRYFSPVSTVRKLVSGISIVWRVTTLKPEELWNSFVRLLCKTFANVCVCVCVCVCLLNCT